jgi:hypothetical protein
MEVLVQHLKSVLHVRLGTGELRDPKCGAFENYLGLEVNSQHSRIHLLNQYKQAST